MIELEGIDHVALSVRDIARSARWYIDVLGFEHRFPGMWDGVPTFIGKGTTALALFPLRANRDKAAAAFACCTSPSARRAQALSLRRRN